MCRGAGYRHALSGILHEQCAGATGAGTYRSSCTPGATAPATAADAGADCAARSAALTVRPVAPVSPAPLAPTLPFAQPTVVPPVPQISPSLPTPEQRLALEIERTAVRLQELNLAEGARWVFFKGNDVIVRANSDDEDEARRARRSFSGDLLWFKLDGKAYVSQDRETMNRVEVASSSTLALEATIKQLATSRQRENNQEQMVRAQVNALQFSLQHLNERLRNLDGNAATQDTLNSARAQLDMIAAQNARLQAMLASTEAEVVKMEAEMQRLEVAKRNAELENRRDLDVLRDAVSSGKAKAAP